MDVIYTVDDVLIFELETLMLQVVSVFGITLRLKKGIDLEVFI